MDHFNPAFLSYVYRVSDNEFGLGHMIMQAIYAILALCGVGGAMWLSIVEDQNLISWYREQRGRSKPKHMSSMDDYIRHTQLDGQELTVINLHTDITDGIMQILMI